jgi:hypothetical protein
VASLPQCSARQFFIGNAVIKAVKAIATDINVPVINLLLVNGRASIDWAPINVNFKRVHVMEHTIDVVVLDARLLWCQPLKELVQGRPKVVARARAHSRITEGA